MHGDTWLTMLSLKESTGKIGKSINVFIKRRDNRGAVKCI